MSTPTGRSTGFPTLRLSAEVATDPELGAAVTAQVRAMRELLYRVLQPIAAGGAPASHHVATLRRRLLETLSTAEVVEVMPLRWEAPAQAMRAVPVLVGLAAWQLLEDEEPSRLRQCRDTSCGWLILDRTKNASRVWCSSADCGNRARARRHYQRARSTGR